MSEFTYFRTKEILSTIIEYLATAEGDMRERLKVMSVEIDLLSQDSFPDNLKRKWEFVEKKLSKHPPVFNWNHTRQDMGSMEHSLSRMQNRTACKIARTIYDLHEGLHFGSN